jgi:curli production assembly/transport component CsgE
MKLILVITLLLFLAFSHVVKSQEIVISGLILDSTISRQGHEFAKNLGRYWQEIPNTFGKNVVVKEIIVPQAVTQVDVVYDNKIIFRTYFGRRLMPLENKVNQAVVMLIEAVAQSDSESNNPDLAGEEW